MLLFTGNFPKNSVRAALILQRQYLKWILSDFNGTHIFFLLQDRNHHDDIRRHIHITIWTPPMQ